MNSTKTTRTTVEILVRHPWPVRLWHWTNALAVTLSLVTGLLIFNIHPSLYWGEDGHAGMPSILSLSVSDPDPKMRRFELRVGSHRWDVTGLMGVIDSEGSDQYVLVVAPPADFQFGGTRIWHFMSAWILVTAWLPLPRVLARARGQAAKRYNLLQKTSYLIVVLVLMPTLILSGLTMSNSVTAVFPELFSLFGGRQSARSV